MHPDNQLSLVPITDEFVYDQDVELGSNFQFVEGGIELGNPVEGITGTVWRGRVFQNRDIFLGSVTTPEVLVYTGMGGITEYSFAFDVNMNPVHVFKDKGETFLNWYDTAVAQRVTTSFGEGLITPKVELDEKRGLLYAHSDIIFAYIKESDLGLYYRQQRDRFTIERKLHDGPFVGLAKMGMNKKLRFQYKLIPLVHRDEHCNVIAP